MQGTTCRPSSTRLTIAAESSERVSLAPAFFGPAPQRDRLLIFLRRLLQRFRLVPGAQQIGFRHLALGRDAISILLGRGAQFGYFGAITSGAGRGRVLALSGLRGRAHFEQVIAFRLRDEENRFALVLTFLAIDVGELFPVRALEFERDVDAALFDNLKQAVEFVTERGGGVVYTELAGTKFAESMKLPDNVQLKPRRVEDIEKDQAA